jgi:hypothetical protein
MICTVGDKLLYSAAFLFVAAMCVWLICMFWG